MPQYFFDARCAQWQYTDPDGIALTDDAAAIAYAERIIRELKEDRGYETPDLKMVVKDESERLIIIINFNPPKVRAMGGSYAVTLMRASGTV